MLEPAAKRGAVGAEACHLGEHRVARRAVEFLAEQVGDERIVAELDQLPSEAPLEVGNAHHRRDQDDRRPRLAVAPSDEGALQALALELVGDGTFLAHDISLASSASFATVFMLRAVPALAAGMRSFDRPIPLG